MLRPASYLGACILIVLIFRYHIVPPDRLSVPTGLPLTYPRSRYLAVMVHLRVYPFPDCTSHASTALVC